ncbi:hypothetical protein Vretimale_18721 [Volvox reticuliferus]|uniref:Protein kinase domain-containing protein n=1 Tax=Volvox reticuliferus TaxID=1737510 RepID=A0A8J4LZ12_9CHLO|nr:hypothetical protein Vretifemale_17184 [Volvox reticuliferus]GIM16060.1 hypothetical protein Vretimale_18721 [Volvox reticuliferus]
MPPFLCCSPSSRSFPVSPEEKKHTVCSPHKKVLDGSANGVPTEPTSGAKQIYKFKTLLDEALLPGQLPDPSGDAAPHRSFDAEKRTGVPLLEDTFSCSTRSRSYGVAVGMTEARQPCTAELAPAGPATSLTKLRIPAHLHGSSASFADDYREGEQVMSPASFSDLGKCPPTACSSEGCGSAPNLGSVWLLMEPPLISSVSRRSGQSRLYRQFQLADPDWAGAPFVTPQLVQQDGTAGQTVAGAAIEASRSSTHVAAVSVTSITQHSCAVRRAVLQQLQAELDTAEALPCCPLLLLPHRVYEQPHTVHVVYDSTGQYVDLYTFLRMKERLPESACRSVMRQLLQALSVLHERRWVHRNISTETVWISEAQLPQAQQLTQPQSQLQSLAQPRQGQEALDEVEVLSETLPSPNQPPAAKAFATIHTPALAVFDSAGGDSQSRPRSDNHRSRPTGGWLPATEDTPQPEPASSLSAFLPQSKRASHSGSSSSCCCGSTHGRCQPSQLQRLQQTQLHVKLGGLALAQRPDVDPDTGQDRPLRELLGCVYHLAPETISGTGYGRPSDVWALGVLLYMLLTGRPPFPGQNELEVMTRVLLAVSATESGLGPPDRRPTSPDDGQAPLWLVSPLPAPVQLLPGQTVTKDPQSASGTLALVCKSDDGCTQSDSGVPSCHQPTGAAAIRDSGTDAMFIWGPRERRPLQELVVQAVLEAHASAACREVLAGMLVPEPKQRLTAAELLRLPWFASRGDGEV